MAKFMINEEVILAPDALGAIRSLPGRTATAGTEMLDASGNVIATRIRTSIDGLPIDVWLPTQAWPYEHPSLSEVDDDETTDQYDMRQSGIMRAAEADTLPELPFEAEAG